jgi:RNA polymerase sigma factor (TIGR02999 family)
MPSLAWFGKAAMTVPSDQPVTELLQAWGNGDEGALDRLTPLVYAELRRIARSYMRRERPGHTLQPTALVNEAFLRLVNVRQVAWQDRTHFFALSARLMRRILTDAARAHQSSKRGSGALIATLEEDSPAASPGHDLVALDHALTSLAALDPRQSQVVELRFFGGLNAEQTANVLGVSSKTVMRDWQTAKVWLLREISRSERGPR